MRRRECVTAAGGALVFGRVHGWAGAWVNPANDYPPNRLPACQSQEPTLGPAVFSRRIERAQAELKTRKWDVLIATPSANYVYFTGDNPGTSERLIALIVPALGDPAMVCPAFEVDRIKAHSGVQDVRGWQEQANPYDLVTKVVRARKPRGNGTIALEASTAFAAYLGLKGALDGWKFEDATGVTARLRSVKSSEEIALIQRAIAITEDALAATFAQLAPGVSERDTARVLASEMGQRGAPGDGLVQFGPSSALPHGAPAGTTLQRETVVLIDCGCRVAGYTSDITRTVWFGDHPSPEFTTVYNLVHDAQTAAIQLGKPLLTPCQEMDRAARRVIAQGGFGPHFTTASATASASTATSHPISSKGTRPASSPGWCSRSSPGSIRRESSGFGSRMIVS
jgi:Xaa-Pro aminopeptidase